MSEILDLSEELAKRSEEGRRETAAFINKFMPDPEVRAEGAIVKQMLHPAIAEMRTKLIKKIVDHYENGKNDILIAMEQFVNRTNEDAMNSKPLQIVEHWMDTVGAVKTKQLDIDFAELLDQKQNTLALPKVSAVGQVIKSTKV